MSIIIGLTGPTGAGKSSLREVAEALGFKHIDCDIVARQAVEKGTEGLKALCQTFGNSILNTDGTLNRKSLAGIAFASPDKTQQLNDAIFPFIKQLVLKQTKNGNTLLDAPTLFESGLDNICFKTIAVLSDKQTRLTRIIKRDNLTRQEAVLRMSAGKDDNFYKENAHYIIYNNGSEIDFLTESRQIISEILKLGEKL